MIKDIAALSQMVSTSRGLTPLVDPIKNRLITHLKTEYGFVVLERRDSGGILYPEFARETRYPSYKHEKDLLTLTEWMKSRNGTLVLQNNEDLLKLNGFQSSWIHQLLGIHLVNGTIRYGTAFFINRPVDPVFSDEEICFAQTCINLMANSLENFYLRKTIETKFRNVLELNRSFVQDNLKLISMVTSSMGSSNDGISGVIVAFNDFNDIQGDRRLLA